MNNKLDGWFRIPKILKKLGCIPTLVKNEWHYSYYADINYRPFTITASEQGYTISGVDGLFTADELVAYLVALKLEGTNSED